MRFNILLLKYKFSKHSKLIGVSIVLLLNNLEFLT
jgi:hypothetical protein